ncbi:MAG: acylneuraminate cytidylyltransferase family protein [Planctomycetes bacterium]|nr:acylneuraminate cytidylyltransferase family protein [Planctomycetota bacterium]
MNHDRKKAAKRARDPYVLSVITARGGSKGIPKKNIAPLGGRPLIAWSIEASLSASLVSRTIVSTDDEEIAAVAAEWGAEVPFMRPAELSGDTAPHDATVLHAAQWHIEDTGSRPDYVLLLQPTSPFRTPADIDAAVRLAIETGADSVVGVQQALSHPMLTKRIDERGRLHAFGVAADGYARRQDLPPAHITNGAIYLARGEVLFERRSLQGEHVVAYEMPAERSLDIDTPWDLHVANLIVRDREGSEKTQHSEAA